MNETPVVRRFLNYVAIPTMSAEDMPGIPSTKKQFALAEYLVRELKELGLEDASVDAHGYVYATLPGTVPAGEDHPVIGLIAHMDTSPEAPDEPVRPAVRLYEGRPVCLNEGLGLYLDEAQYPELGSYAGKHLIVTDGTTLLGGDDKASIASIMTMASYYCAHPEIPHGLICLAFTPDEEVGGLAHTMDLARFGSPVAYTLDGDHLG
jgi:tripeptide aminopeptidase